MSNPNPIRRLLAATLVAFLASGVLLSVRLPARAAGDHLVISEVVTGGGSASDELIELHNPTAGPLPLDGLELIYASATGTTVSRRAAWALGAGDVPPGGHVLVANEAGVYAGIADATYASGMAAAGGSVAIRILGASSAIDAVGWGTASSTWVEGSVAPAPATGSSLERLPGGNAGSGQDTNDNATDFVERSVPDPQNLASPPTLGPDGESGDPTPPPTAAPTAAPTAPSSSDQPSGPATLAIGTARSLPDGTRVSIEGVAVSGSAFHDGGGFVADATGGIAVLVEGGAFARGARVRASGTIENRYAQRTLRVAAADMVVLGTGSEPAPAPLTTAGVGESSEGRLVRVAGSITGGRSELAAGTAFDFDDGSGATRLLVTAGSGIDSAAWSTGTVLTVVGIVGQRDSSGTGAAGYRLMLRDRADVIGVGAPSASRAAPGPSTGASGGPGPTAGDTGVTIAAARAAERNARLVVRGTVTLPPGVVDADTAVIQDATGAIAIRLGEGTGTLRLGDRVELSGVRSTKSGMETVRVTQPVVHLGSATLPEAQPMRTGDASEAEEARRILVRGALTGAPRRASSGSVSFDIDDGSGPLKIAMGAGIGFDRDTVSEGSWVEVTGVLGQVTTGSAPTAGYRVWPASAASVRVTATAGEGSGQPGDGGGPGGTGGPGSGAPPGGLDDVGAPGLEGMRIGATLVAGPWPELGIAGLLWDGTRLVAIDAASTALVEPLLVGRRPPLALDLGGLEAVGIEPRTGVGRVRLGDEPGDVLLAGTPVAPTARPRSDPAWASMIGLVLGSRQHPVLLVPGGAYRVDVRCERDEPRRGLLSVTGIALDRPDRLVVGCGGMRRVPILARAGAVPILGPSFRGGSPPATSPGPAPGAPAPMAAGMLATAAIASAGAAALARLRAGRRPPDDEPTDAAADPSPESEADGAPRLTLVPIPRERAP